MGSLIRETPYSEITATLEVLDRHHITREHLSRLRSDQHYADQVAESILAAEQRHFAIIVDYSQTVEEMIRAGRYDDASVELNSENFPRQRGGRSEVIIELVRFDRLLDTEEVVHELDGRGLRPANLPELLALGARYPDLQRTFPVVALGLYWHHGRVVACLWGDAHTRGLGFDWLGVRWDRAHRFAAVAK